MLIDLTEKELKFIKTGIEVAQFESVLPESDDSVEIKNLLNKLGANEWLMIRGENYFTLIDEFRCSECNKIVSGGPPKMCPECGSVNEYRGNTVSCRIEEGNIDDG